MEKEEKTGTIAQRFTNAVVSAYGDVARGIDVTPKQMQLISNYYIKLDEMFKNPDINIFWKQVKLPALANTLAHMAKLNLDMALGQLSFIPFFDRKSGKYNLVSIISAKGYEYIAKTYGLDSPEHATVELVYSTDKFSIAKKDANHECDSYTFEVQNPFDRGKIVGGFGYLEFSDKTKNFILVMSEADILKYKPRNASNNFWSGENMKKMYEKTIAKQLFKKVTLDPDKVNSVSDSFKQIEVQELNFTLAEAKNTIDENMCSGEVVDIDVEVSDSNPVENTVEVVEGSDMFVDEVTEEDKILGV